MKTSKELIKSLKIGDKFYYMDCSAANIDDIRYDIVKALYLNGHDGQINNQFEICRDYFLDKYGLSCVISDNYEDLLCVVKDNAKKRINEQLEAITQICEQIAQYKTTIHTCDNILREYERRKVQRRT